MNVYDFDGTIYKGDSTIDFYLYALKTNPKLVCCLPKQLLGIAKYILKKIDKTQFKEQFFCFLNDIDTEELVKGFWSKHSHKIHTWYLEQKAEDDIIISASPDFLLRPICMNLGIQHLIASRVDCNTGKFTGKNCRGQEKVRRLQEEYNINHINNFYSDSVSDLPMARIADNAFLVKKGKIRIWKEEREI